MREIHLDTDLGGDIDDLCALAMLLRSEDAELTGITTVAEDNGRRAGYVRYVLAMEGKNSIPVAAGADVSGGFYRYPELGFPDELRYWPEPVVPSPNQVEQALALLKQSIEQGATVIAIGPFTNLYLLDLQYPGILRQAHLCLMGGYVYPVRAGFPQWGNDMDWNVQVDVRSAKHGLDHSSPTLVPLSVTVETALRRRDLGDLKKAGDLGRLIARQAEAFAIDEQIETKYGARCEGLPDDILNFQHDGLACAIATGWNDGVVVEELRLSTEEQNGWLVERIDPAGKPARVVMRINGEGFNEYWLNAIVKR